MCARGSGDARARQAVRGRAATMHAESRVSRRTKQACHRRGNVVPPIGLKELANELPDRRLTKMWSRQGRTGQRSTSRCSCSCSGMEEASCSQHLLHCMTHQPDLPSHAVPMQCPCFQESPISPVHACSRGQCVGDHQDSRAEVARLQIRVRQLNKIVCGTQQ